MLRTSLCIGLLLAVACDDEGPAGPAATVLAEIPVQAWCDQVGVEQIVLRAMASACLPDATDCDPAQDLPKIQGDRISCPVSASMALMGVENAAPARYRIEVERIRSADGPEVDCLASEAGSTTWEIGPDAIDASSTLQAAPGVRPCPDR